MKVRSTISTGLESILATRPWHLNITSSKGVPMRVSSSAYTSLDRMPAQNWGALLSGTALAVFGLSRKSRWGLALAGAGGLLAYAAVRSANSRPQDPAHCTLTLNTSPEEAYRFWKDFESMPRYVNHLQSVEKVGENRYRWTAILPTRKTVSWDAEIKTDVPNEKIAWQSLSDSDVQVNGSVQFRRGPQDRGTLVTAKIQYYPNGANGASKAANLLSKTASFVLRQDMRRIKALVETGEIPTTEGQSHGPRSRLTGTIRSFDVTQEPPARGTSFVQHLDEKRRAS